MASRAVCALCQSDEGKMNADGEKGLRTILRASYEKEEDDIYERLMIFRDKSSPLYVHNNCRRKLDDLRKKPLYEAKKLRSSTEVAFYWKECCFLCLKPTSVSLFILFIPFSFSFCYYYHYYFCFLF